MTLRNHNESNVLEESAKDYLGLKQVLLNPNFYNSKIVKFA